MCVRALPAEDVVVLPAGTAWRVPWELLMLGPFTSCVLDDGDLMRHVTATSMIRSALRATSIPAARLLPDDYPPLLTLPGDMTVIEAVRSVVDSGWDLAVVLQSEPRLITSRTIIRSLLNSTSTTSISDAEVGPVEMPVSWQPEANATTLLRARLA